MYAKCGRLPLGRATASNKTCRYKGSVSSPTLLAKYLRLRRERLGADPVTDLHHRLSYEIAQLELDFVEMGVSPFAETQPFERVA